MLTLIFKLGTLEYRSVRFENELLDKPNFQGNAAVNYTDAETPWTRIIEHKWFEFGKDENGNDLPKTVISREYSSEWKPGDEPYYPVNDEKNGSFMRSTRSLQKREENVIFGGRLGEYKYYDMDRKDYDKLLNYLIKNKESVFPLKAVYVWHKQKYMYAMARITDMTTVLKYSYYGAYTEDDMGTFIDIYPLDGMGNDYSNAITISRKTGYLRKWITWAHYDKHIINNNKLKNICVFMLERIAHIIGEDFFQKKLIAYTKKYDYDSSRYVGCITWHDTIYCWDRLNIEGDTKLEFEGERFRVPQKYDSFLKQLYGNYMKLPPKEERHSTHYYKAYKRGELDE